MKKQRKTKSWRPPVEGWEALERARKLFPDESENRLITLAVLKAYFDREAAENVVNKMRGKSLLAMARAFEELVFAVAGEEPPKGRSTST